MNSIQQLIADVLIMMSNKYNSKLAAFLAVNQAEIHLKYPNTTYTRWPPFLVMMRYINKAINYTDNGEVFGLFVH